MTNLDDPARRAVAELERVLLGRHPHPADPTRRAAARPSTPPDEVADTLMRVYHDAVTPDALRAGIARLFTAAARHDLTEQIAAARTIANEHHRTDPTGA